MDTNKKPTQSAISTQAHDNRFAAYGKYLQKSTSARLKYQQQKENYQKRKEEILRELQLANDVWIEAMKQLPEPVFH